MAEHGAFRIGTKPYTTAEIVLIPTRREGLFLHAAVGRGLFPMDPRIGVRGDILEAVFHRMRIAPARVVEGFRQIVARIAQGAEAQNVHVVDVVNHRDMRIDLGFASKGNVGQPT